MLQNIDYETSNFIKTFEGAVDKAAEFHNINTKILYDYFDKELEEIKSTNRPNRYRFDLHGFTLLEANEKVKELINSCQQKGFKEILLIQGNLKCHKSLFCAK